MAKSIIVTIPGKGLAEGETSVNVEAAGYSGSGCADASARFLDALGSVNEQELKAEYYEPGEQQEHLTNG